MFKNIKHKYLFMKESKGWEITKEILNNPEKEIHVRDIAKKLGVSPGLVSITVNELREKGFVKGNCVDITNPNVRAQKILINVETLNNIIDFLKKFGVLGVGLYGSYAKGTNTASSDVDLWIKVKKHPDIIKIANLRAQIRNRINVEPSLLFLTNEKISEMREKNPSLYYSLYHGFVLRGENID